MARFIESIKISIITVFFKLLYGSCKWHIEGMENIEKIVRSNRSAILVYWHGNMLIPYYKLAKYNFHILAGFHRDAELGVKIGKRLGWRFFRGSSSKKGSEVFQEIVDFLKRDGNIIAITPDGPKGPAKIPKPGSVRAAQKLGIPIIPIAGRSGKSWGFTNWDTFYLAKPFTKTIMKIAEPVYFSEDEDFESCNANLAERLDQLEQTIKISLEK